MNFTIRKPSGFPCRRASPPRFDPNTRQFVRFQFGFHGTFGGSVRSHASSWPPRSFANMSNAWHDGQIWKGAVICKVSTFEVGRVQQARQATQPDQPAAAHATMQAAARNLRFLTFYKHACMRIAG